jgi:hypothetical protein
MSWETRKPCKSCPYRKDVPLGTWAQEEFDNLLAQDADPIRGSMFGCHKYRHRPDEAHVCAGWLLDQKSRNLPSTPLRIALIRSEEAQRAIEEVTDGGLELYDSIEEMTEADRRTNDAIDRAVARRGVRRHRE